MATRPDAGFTLVEMLIAVGLVLLIMTMFASIFQIATESLSKQRGLAENDQRARLLSTIIRADLEKRTFRDVIPFAHNQDTSQLGGQLVRRSGYWYYAENDPSDDTDDVLQFTVRSKISAQSSDKTPYIGRSIVFFALPIVAQNAGTGVFSVSGDVTGYFPIPYLATTNSHVWVAGNSTPGTQQSNDGRYSILNVTKNGTNTDITIDLSLVPPLASTTIFGTIYLTELQPELDDGIVGNSLGQSTAAEVSYYLRGGNLYRRVLLIRDANTADAQPQLANGSEFISGRRIASGDEL